MATLNQPAEEWVREFRTEFRNSAGRLQGAVVQGGAVDVAVAWLCIVSTCLCLWYLGFHLRTVRAENPLRRMKWKRKTTHEMTCGA